MAAALLLAASFASPGFAAGSDFAAAVKNMPAQSDKFRSMMSNLSVAQFHFVSVAGEVDPAMLKKNASAIADLRDTLGHATLTDNQGIVVPLRKVLQSKNLTVDNIVGISVGGSQITLYYQ
ncbi:MAG TPA: hypothetical protein VFW34_05650 [Candidatus Rubrimentiphilum sp.]|nr:hypothetical protein [Candidatus Rubrimentiphilum sp.]